MNKQLIIKALKIGTPVRRICKETGINERTLWRYIKKDKELQMAMSYYLTIVDNVFN